MRDHHPDGVHSHVHLHLEPGPGLEQLLQIFREILQEMKQMSAELDRLTTEVGETGTVVDSAIALIQGLAEQIRQLATDPVALGKLADDLDAKTNALAAAVEANTTPTPPPVEPPVT